MPNSKTVISTIKSISSTKAALEAKPKGDARIMTINFDGERFGHLDLKIPLSAIWAKIIERLKASNRHVYVEIDPDTSTITQLHIPEVSKVVDISPDEGGNMLVHLAPSAAAHYLLRTNPNFDSLLTALQSAKASNSDLLTTTNFENRELLDVRPFVRTPQNNPPGPIPDDPPVTEARALELFNMMKSRTCDPVTPVAPCITFLYPDDGCYARAHEMCRLMLAEGEVPGKIWIYADSDTNLHVETSNNPSCSVNWWYHVAPTLLVTTAGGDVTKVIDPSLFDAPVTPAAWQAITNDPGSTLEYSDCSIFFKGRSDPVGMTDADYSQTNSALHDMRDNLEIRCATYGPPPYQCPILRHCFFIVDRSTFSQYEVQAMLSSSATAEINAAFYLALDGYAPSELGITPATPTDPPLYIPTLISTPGTPHMTLTPTNLDFEDPVHLIRRQRITWTYKVSFNATTDFTAEVIPILLTATISGYSATATIYLTTQPNPYEIDGPVSWLSTDLRVFQIKTGESKFNAAMGANPNTFITQVVNNLNSGNTAGQTFDANISTDQQASKLELSQTVAGVNVYNFAVAKIRYRALAVPAANVRAFFRIFQTSSTSMEYNTATTYRSASSGGNVIPLLGVAGGETVTIPCFASSRVDSSSVSLTLQTDPLNVQTLPANPAGNEMIKYFGCWLDINQTTPQFPINPAPVDGPFAAGRIPIQQWIRNRHQCLVAEISFDPAPIPAGTSPALCDRLAQRNLAIVESDNPGSLDSHRIPHTFEIRPTPDSLALHEMYDELMIDWGTIPYGCNASIYLPACDSTGLMKLKARLSRTNLIALLDEHTIQCKTGGISYIPIPKGGKTNFAGLITIDLPDTVKKGQVFKVVMRQITGVIKTATVVRLTAETESPLAGMRRILGSFQITIPVSTKTEILDSEVRLLGNLKWIQKAIPSNNRWFGVFSRYTDQTAGRVNALGGKADSVVASPGDSPGGGVTNVCLRYWLALVLLIAILIVFAGVLTGAALTASVTAAIAALAATASMWIKNCKPSLCTKLKCVLAGTAIGAAALFILLLMGVSAPQLVTVLIISAVIAIAVFVICLIKKCF